MQPSTRLALLVACVVSLPDPVLAQRTLRDTTRSRISSDVAVGMMRFGPHVALGATIATPQARIGARFDLMLGVAPADVVPGTNFVAASVAGVLPIQPTRRVVPYLLAGAGVSLSRYMDPAIGPVVGTGVRVQLGALRPYAEARVQQRAGAAFLLGLSFP